MKLSPLSWICTVLTLYSVSFSATQLIVTDPPDAMQLARMDQVDFCDYVESLNVEQVVPANMDVEMAMLVKVAEEERNLDLEDDEQRTRKQQILKSVRTFVRIRSRLPIVCKATDKEELEHLAQVFESTCRDFSSFSESPTWEKACVAGLFGRNTLATLLPHLSEEFFSHNKDLLLEAAFSIGDIDSVKTIVNFFKLSEKDVLEKVPELDVVVSGAVPFLGDLVKFLPNLMEKRVGLIREASSLNHFDILLRLLEVATPAKIYELKQILDSLCRLKIFKDGPIIAGHTKCELGYILVVAAQHGHLPIIRFLWLAIKASPNDSEAVIKDMMTGAGWNNHRNVIEFLLWKSGGDYMKMAQEYVNDAFEAAAGGGHIDLMDFFRGDDNAGNPVAPRLCLTTLKTKTLYQALGDHKTWKGIKYLVDLKKEGDHRFADFELVDPDNDALCAACTAGDYDLVEYLLCRTGDGEFVFPRTNPAAQGNKPIVNACWSGNLQIVEKLLERGVSGKYIYKNIDPSAQDYQSIVNACLYGRQRVLEFLLKMKDGKYVLPEMEGVNFTRALILASRWDQIEILRFLLTMKDGKYVLPEMNGVDLTRALWEAINRDRLEIARLFLSRALDGSYLHPGVKVTEDMLTMVDQSPEMRELLAMHQRQEHVGV